MNRIVSSSAAARAQASLPLSRALELFAVAYRARNMSPETMRWYQERMRPYVEYLRKTLEREPTLGDLSIPGFRLFVLERMADGRYHHHPFKTASPGPPSAAHMHAFYRAVRGFSSWLYRERLIPFNVMAELELPRLEQRELQPLTPEEELRLVNSYSETNPAECRNKAIMMLLLSTGIRKAELVGLKDEAVNMEEGFITVWGKGKRQRSVPFGFKTGWVLQRYRSLYRPEPVTPSCDTFFLTVEGYPISIRSVDMLFQRARKRTGISRLHPHLLRHTYGTRSAELGIPTLTLQRFMGHSQPTVTERYSHVALSERLKRERGYDHLDTLDFRVRRPRRQMER